MALVPGSSVTGAGAIGSAQTFGMPNVSTIQLDKNNNGIASSEAFGNQVFPVFLTGIGAVAGSETFGTLYATGPQTTIYINGSWHSVNPNRAGTSYTTKQGTTALIVKLTSNSLWPASASQWTNVKFNGVTMTWVGGGTVDTDNVSTNAHTYILINPPVGTYNFTWDNSGGTQNCIGIEVVEFGGVDGYNAAVQYVGNTVSPVSLSPASNLHEVIFATLQSYDNNITDGSGMTRIQSGVCGTGDETWSHGTAGTTSIQWTWTLTCSSGYCGEVGVAFALYPKMSVYFSPFANGIASAEAFGATSVNAQISYSGIPSREQDGQPTIVLIYTLNPAVIAVGEAFGSDLVAPIDVMYSGWWLG
jgi:hypothetical protein